MQHMKIVPASIEEQINRVDPQRSRIIGISFAVLAAGSAFRLFSLLYVSLSFGRVAGSLIFSFVFWAVIGVVAAIAAVGFLERAKRPASNREDS
jgi:hypothetical protein